jgi:translation initiation factor 2 beta subunit (eIF-2beta)/eIF-5
MEEIFNKLFRLGLTPNCYYALHSIKNKTTTDPSISINLEVAKLEAGGWLDNGHLTTKSLKLYQEIEAYFRSSKKKTSVDIMGDDFSTKIDEYLDIFPKFKLPSGKYARSDKKNLENNFRWFFETHSYDWDTVINATKMYVDEYERQGYKYMRTSQYFIRKQNPIEKTFESELANYCEVYLNGSDDYNYDSHFKEKVV